LTRKQESPQAGFPARFEQARNGREVATSNVVNYLKIAFLEIVERDDSPDASALQPGCICDRRTFELWRA
jgi:hypothetical protein